LIYERVTVVNRAAQSGTMQRVDRQEARYRAGGKGWSRVGCCAMLAVDRASISGAKIVINLLRLARMMVI
jgi:hypothetical protein